MISRLLFLSKKDELGKIRELGRSFLASAKPHSTELHIHAASFTTRAMVHSSRGFSQYKSFLLSNRGNPYTSQHGMKTFSSLSYTGTMAYQAQIAWKRLSSLKHSRRVSSAVVSRVACALTLAAQRYHVVPYLFAFTAGGAALTTRAHADGDYSFPQSNSIYMHAQDSRVYLTNFILSVAEFVVLLIRSMYLALLFTPSIVMAPFAERFDGQFRQTWLRVVRRTLEEAGPAFIKWGQWAATRPDLFPADLCTELSKLHTKAPAHSFAYTKRTVEKSFGRKISDIFDDFEEEPVASGSVAQVHRARLKNAKQLTVAVKVRHPGVGEAIRRDFNIINAVAKISNCIPTLRWLRLDESVQQFAVFMMAQVDLAREAAHLSRFIYNFRRWKDVSFPRPVYPLVHPAVLVETYEDGDSVSRYVDELEGHDRLKSALAHIGTHALLKMLLVDNFVHADMHPGNILVRVVRPKSAKKSRPHVVFLDVGMTAELSSTDRVNLIEFFKSVALRDGRTAALSALRLSKNQKCPNPQAFIEEVEKSFSFWGTAEGDVVHPAECMHQLLDQVRRHKVNIDGNVCTVMVTTLVLEGWQRKLDPDYDVMQTLRTLLFKADWAKDLRYTMEGLA
ncbi:uncharacterized protein LOC144562157 isoform X1 [Carex rostrata]